MKAKLIQVVYIEETQSILLLLEKDGSQQRMQVHRKDIATFGNRNENEITETMHQYANTLNKIYQDREIEVIKATKSD
jgi:hypothetical protein